MTATLAEADPRRIARDLRAALDALARALDAGDAAGVLDCEPALHAAIARQASGPVPADARAALADDLAAARAALARCRAIGAASAQVVGVTLDTLGRATGYGRHGAAAPRGTRGHDVHARV